MRSKAWLAVSLSLFIFGLILFLYSDRYVFYFYAPCSIITILVFPYYHKWRLKKQYVGFVKENYKNNVGKASNLLFDQEHFTHSNTMGESKINYSSIGKMVEISSHFFLILKTGTELIIPKSAFDTVEAIQTQLKAIASTHEIPYATELEWKWQ